MAQLHRPKHLGKRRLKDVKQPIGFYSVGRPKQVPITVCISIGNQTCAKVTMHTSTCKLLPSQASRQAALLVHHASVMHDAYASWNSVIRVLSAVVGVCSRSANVAHALSVASVIKAAVNCVKCQGASLAHSPACCVANHGRSLRGCY